MIPTLNQIQPHQKIKRGVHSRRLLSSIGFSLFLIHSGCRPTNQKPLKLRLPFTADMLPLPAIPEKELPPASFPVPVASPVPASPQVPVGGGSAASSLVPVSPQVPVVSPAPASSQVPVPVVSPAPASSQVPVAVVSPVPASSQVPVDGRSAASVLLSAFVAESAKCGLDEGNRAESDAVSLLLLSALESTEDKLGGGDQVQSDPSSPAVELTEHALPKQKRKPWYTRTGDFFRKKKTSKNTPLQEKMTPEEIFIYEHELFREKQYKRLQQGEEALIRIIDPEERTFDAALKKLELEEKIHSTEQNEKIQRLEQELASIMGLNDTVSLKVSLGELKQLKQSYLKKEVEQAIQYCHNYIEPDCQERVDDSNDNDYDYDYDSFGSDEDNR